MRTAQFKILILPLAERIYPMAKRLLNSGPEAEDAVQEIMLRLWNKRKELEKHNNPVGYALLTARNFCLDMLKKKKPELTIDKHQMQVANLRAVEGDYESREAVLIVQKILNTLPAQQKSVIQLRDFDGFEMDEIAAMLQIEVPHARVLLSRARKSVRQQMTKIYSYEQQTSKAAREIL